MAPSGKIRAGELLVIPFDGTEYSQALVLILLSFMTAPVMSTVLENI